jgi:hypothetical protein
LGKRRRPRGGQELGKEEAKTQRRSWERESRGIATDKEAKIHIKSRATEKEKEAVENGNFMGFVPKLTRLQSS